MRARSKLLRSTLFGPMLMLVVGVSACSSQSSAATISPAATLPNDFSVPQISFSSLPHPAQSIDCDALIAGFVGLASDPVAAKPQVLEALETLKRDAPSALAPDLAALTTAITGVSDQASAAKLLSTPTLANSFSRVQVYLQTQCPQ